MSTTTKVTSADAGAKIMVVGLIDMGPGQSLRQIGVVFVRIPGGPVVLISERDIATTDLVQAQPEDSIASVGQMMLEPWVRHIAVWEGDAVVVLGVDL